MANLLKRDKEELTGKVGIGAQAYEAFGEEAKPDKMETVEDFPDAFKPAAGVIACSPQLPCNRTPLGAVTHRKKCLSMHESFMCLWLHYIAP